MLEFLQNQGTLYVGSYVAELFSIPCFLGILLGVHRRIASLKLLRISTPVYKTQALAVLRETQKKIEFL